MIIQFSLDDSKINLDSTDCTQAHIASIAAYCILALAQDKGERPDDIVVDLLRICKGCLKNEA